MLRTEMGRHLRKLRRFYEREMRGWQSRDPVACMVRYLIRHDPKRGLREAERHGSWWAERSDGTALRKLLAPWYSPAAEEVAISFLDRQPPDDVMSAVILLKGKGSQRCVDALIARMGTLEPGSEKAFEFPGRFTAKEVRRRMREALLKTDRWTVSEEQLEMLKANLKDDEERSWYRFHLNTRGKARTILTVP